MLRCGDKGVAYDQYGEGTCDYPCAGDATANCGGYLSQAVYDIGALFCFFV